MLYFETSGATKQDSFSPVIYKKYFLYSIYKSYPEVLYSRKDNHAGLDILFEYSKLTFNGLFTQNQE